MDEVIIVAWAGLGVLIAEHLQVLIAAKRRPAHVACVCFWGLWLFAIGYYIYYSGIKMLIMSFLSLWNESCVKSSRCLGIRYGQHLGYGNTVEPQNAAQRHNKAQDMFRHAHSV